MSAVAAEVQDDQVEVTLLYSGPGEGFPVGWYWYESEYPEEGASGPFETEQAARANMDCTHVVTTYRPPSWKLGAEAQLSVKIVAFCEEPNTGLALVEIENPERDKPWVVSVPIACLQPVPVLSEAS